MSVSKRQFVRYVNAGHSLAELLKRNIQKDGLITNETVLALNEFIIASNEIKDLTDEVREDDKTLN